MKTLDIVERYGENGYVIVTQLFDSVEVEELQSAFDGLHEVAEEVLEQYVAAHEVPAPGTVFSVEDHRARFTYRRSLDGGCYYIRHVAGCGKIAPALDSFGRDPRLLALAAELLGSSEMIRLVNQADYRSPREETAFHWHQGVAHLGTGSGGFRDVNGRGSFVRIALMLDDVTARNGPLELIPGSHRLGDLGLTEENRDRVLAAKTELAKAVAPMLAAGDAIAYGPYTLHGSKPNTSRHWRRVFMNGFALPDAHMQRGDSGQELLRLAAR